MTKTFNSYLDLGYDIVRKVLANCDKCSANNQSKVVLSPWGIIRMYRTSSKNRGRFYSVSQSKVLHNGGSYKMSTLRTKLSVFR